MIEPASPWPHCPDCGGDVQVVRRVRAGRGPSSAPARLRYRCASPACGWRAPRIRAQRLPGDGLSAAAVPALRAWWAAIRRPARTAAVGLVVAFSVVAPLAVVALIGVGAMAGRQVALGVAPGESHDGAPAKPGLLGGTLLPAALQAPGAPVPMDTLAHGLALRRGCHWGQPGRNPYRGTMAQALQAAGLPAEVVRAIVAQQQAGQTAGRLSITRDTIRHTTDGREFDPGAVALTFGHTLCADTRVNFAPGHEELADYYEARDGQGRLHSVMVPDVCGNVSVLAARGERGVVAGMAALLAQRSEALAQLADALAGPAGHPPGDGAAAGGAGGAGARAGAEGVEGQAGAAGAAGAGDGQGGRPAAADVAGGGTRMSAGGPSTAGASTSPAVASPLAAGRPSVAPGAGGAPAPSTGLGLALVADRAPAGRSDSPVLTALGRVTEQVVSRATAAAAAAAAAEALSRRSDEVARLAQALGDRGPTGAGTGPGTTRAVPEPGTLAVVLLGLVALLAQRRRRRADR